MSTERTYPAPPFDAELAPMLAELTSQIPSTLSLDDLLAMRAPPPEAAIDEMLAARDIVRTDHIVPGLDGDPGITVSVFMKRTHVPGGPGIYTVHGGGMVLGNRLAGAVMALEWVQLFDAVAIGVEYRLAPEHPDPAPIRDCYAGLVWTAAHAGDLGFDPGRLIITGASAGGGLAAGTALMARDHGGPALAAQILVCPMIDDRNDTISSRQFDGVGLWDRSANKVGWDALLGDRRGTDQVSIYAAPARATDLSGLPPAYIDCGSAEVFRDEDVAYASAIWAAGGTAELHIWAGGFHSFDGMVPQAAISVAARATRTEFVGRILGMSGRTMDPLDAG
ncbi:MAG TPA: alpha/beta hydrolase fold domain-containing protein [Chloroflexota bacterium]|nr:alpha/beta hydrolase fold domain-containing protein [Chloroflexota bacterium]